MTALGFLSHWLSFFPSLQRVWAQGPSFDVAILEGYYQRLGLDTPWEFRMARDTRTVYDIARQGGWEKPGGTEPVHNGRHDCLRQITCLVDALFFIAGAKKVV